MGTAEDHNEEESQESRLVLAQRIRLVRNWTRTIRHMVMRIGQQPPPGPRPRVRVGNYRVPVPRSRIGRTTLGVSLIVIGTLGFAMPVIGLWMWGPGMLVLSVDSHRVRRFRRRFEVRTVRWWRRRRAARAAARARRRRHGS